MIFLSNLTLAVCGMFLSLLFTACVGGKDRTYEHNISKNGEVSIKSLHNIILEHPDTMSFSKMPPPDFNNTFEGSKKVFLLEVPIYDQQADNSNGSYFGYRFYIKPCSDNISDNIDKTPILHEVDVPRTLNVGLAFDYYFKLSTLQENGLIAENSNNQVNLCTYIYWKTTQMGGGHDYHKSNKLVYTAEEINAAMAEYEQFKAKEE